jgi:hypothetical protein
MAGYFWKPYKGHAVDDKLYMLMLIGGAEEQIAIQLQMSMWLRKTGDKSLLKTPWT